MYSLDSSNQGTYTLIKATKNHYLYINNTEEKNPTLMKNSVIGKQSIISESENNRMKSH